MSPIWESSGHLEGYVFVVEGDVEGVFFTDGKPFGSGGYPVLTGLDTCKLGTVLCSHSKKITCRRNVRRQKAR